jgi:MoaA/NifB/PqqE/SkfB family radical SAM enzyme
LDHNPGTVTEKDKLHAIVNQEGHLVLPPEVVERFGFTPGAEVPLTIAAHGVHLKRPFTHLAKVYLEPTNSCNLDCRTCMRNAWDEPLGTMPTQVFERILDGLKGYSTAPEISFGGLGEPLLHKQIGAMVSQAKALGARVELITNGTLLSEPRSQELIQAGLDMLWVSIDGARPESYMDVRLGAELPQVLENVARFHSLRSSLRHKTEIGIVFVAMQQNIKELSEMLSLATRLGASRFMISHVLPYTSQMRDQRLYARLIPQEAAASRQLKIRLPQSNFNSLAAALFDQLPESGYTIAFDDFEITRRESCPFVERGSLSVRWDGAVSPCLLLLHPHTSFLDEHRRAIQACVVGNVQEQSLIDVWNSASYRSLRARLQDFDFSPCLYCGGCDLVEGNQEDCTGNEFPACGGCLWARGLIQCP